MYCSDSSSLGISSNYNKRDKNTAYLPF